MFSGTRFRLFAVIGFMCCPALCFSYIIFLQFLCIARGLKYENQIIKVWNKASNFVTVYRAVCRVRCWQINAHTNMQRWYAGAQSTQEIKFINSFIKCTWIYALIALHTYTIKFELLDIACECDVNIRLVSASEPLIRSQWKLIYIQLYSP